MAPTTKNVAKLAVPTALILAGVSMCRHRFVLDNENEVVRPGVEDQANDILYTNREGPILAVPGSKDLESRHPTVDLSLDYARQLIEGVAQLNKIHRLDIKELDAVLKQSPGPFGASLNDKAPDRAVSVDMLRMSSRFKLEGDDDNGPFRALMSDVKRSDERLIREAYLRTPEASALLERLAADSPERRDIVRRDIVFGSDIASATPHADIAGEFLLRVPPQDLDQWIAECGEFIRTYETRWQSGSRGELGEVPSAIPGLLYPYLGFGPYTGILGKLESEKGKGENEEIGRMTRTVVDDLYNLFQGPTDSDRRIHRRNREQSADMQNFFVDVTPGETRIESGIVDLFSKYPEFGVLIAARVFEDSRLLASTTIPHETDNSFEMAVACLEHLEKYLSEMCSTGLDGELDDHNHAINVSLPHGREEVLLSGRTPDVSDNDEILRERLIGLLARHAPDRLIAMIGNDKLDLVLRIQMTGELIARRSLTLSEIEVINSNRGAPGYEATVFGVVKFLTGGAAYEAPPAGCQTVKEDTLTPEGAVHFLKSVAFNARLASGLRSFAIIGLAISSFGKVQAAELRPLIRDNDPAVAVCAALCLSYVDPTLKSHLVALESTTHPAVALSAVLNICDDGVGPVRAEDRHRRHALESYGMAAAEYLEQAGYPQEGVAKALRDLAGYTDNETIKTYTEARDDSRALAGFTFSHPGLKLLVDRQVITSPVSRRIPPIVSEHTEIPIGQTNYGYAVIRFDDRVFVDIVQENNGHLEEILAPLLDYYANLTRLLTFIGPTPYRSQTSERFKNLRFGDTGRLLSKINNLR